VGGQKMAKVKKEIEKILSDIFGEKVSANILENDLPEKAIFEPSYVFSISPSIPNFRPINRFSIEEDMIYLYELLRNNEILKMRKDFSIEIDNLKELFENSVEKEFVLKLKDKEFPRTIVDIVIKKDGSYRLRSHYEFALCDEKCLKERLASQRGAKINVHLEKVFLFEVPELNYLLNELRFIFPKGNLIFGKKAIYGSFDEPVFCYLHLNKPKTKRGGKNDL
jgi:hypothetical protein